MGIANIIPDEIFVEIENCKGQARYNSLIKRLKKAEVNAEMYEDIGRKCIKIFPNDGLGLEKIRSYLIRHNSERQSLLTNIAKD